MPEETLPSWLLRLLTDEVIRFAEDDDEEEDDGDSDDDTDDDDEDTGDEDEDDEDEEDDDTKPKGKAKKSTKKSAVDREKERADGLEEALRKERLARRKAEREARAAKKSSGATKKAPAKKAVPAKGSQESETDSETEQELQALKARSDSLAGKLLDNAIETLVLRVASAKEFNFADPSDAAAFIKRKDIEVDQDDEDPTDIEIDETSVKKALRTLAKQKPHLLKPKSKKDEDEEEEEGEDEEEEEPSRRTTSKFGGRRKKGKQLDEAKLKEKYPALRRG